MSNIVHLPVSALLFLILLTVLASGCAPEQPRNRPAEASTPAPGETPSPGSTKRNQFTASDSTIGVAKGEEFTIILDSNPTTGYSWRLAQPLDGKILALVGSEYLQPTPSGKTPIVGAGGKDLWVFKALAQGNAEISLEYVRAWEKESRPAQTAAFKVVVR